MTRTDPNKLVRAIAGSPLHQAAADGEDDDIVNLLTATDSQVDLRVGDVTPLHLAVKHNHATTVRTLGEQGANLELRTQEGLTYLYLAAMSLSFDAMTVLLELRMNPALINEVIAGNPPLLFQMIEQRQANLVAMLLECGASVTMKHNHLTPLQFATMLGDADSLEALLKHRADIHVVDAHANSIMHIAAHRNHAHLIKQLDDYSDGELVDARNIRQETPLHITASHNAIHAANALLDHGADPNLQDIHGNTPLHIALTLRHFALANALIAKGARLDVVNKKGKTPLELLPFPAASLGHAIIYNWQSLAKAIAGDMVTAPPFWGALNTILVNPQGSFNAAKRLILMWAKDHNRLSYQPAQLEFIQMIKSASTENQRALMGAVLNTLARVHPDSSCIILGSRELSYRAQTTMLLIKRYGLDMVKSLLPKRTDRLKVVYALAQYYHMSFEGIHYSDTGGAWARKRSKKRRALFNTTVSEQAADDLFQVLNERFTGNRLTPQQIRHAVSRQHTPFNMRSFVLRPRSPKIDRDTIYQIALQLLAPSHIVAQRVIQTPK